MEGTLDLLPASDSFEVPDFTSPDKSDFYSSANKRAALGDPAASLLEKDRIGNGNPYLLRRVIRAADDSLTNCRRNRRGGASSLDWLKRAAFTFDLYRDGATFEMDIETANGSDIYAVAFATIGASPFAFDVLRSAFIGSQKALNVEDMPLRNEPPRLLVSGDVDMSAINRDVYVCVPFGAMIEEPKSKPARYFGFWH